MHDAAVKSNSVRYAAHLILCGAIVLYVYAVRLPLDNSFRDLLLAFSEAAMVGGLADWFAVTALFRRPLGLPIPHTAIIPSNKERIGKNFGTFIQKNFLASDVLSEKLDNIDFSGTIFGWLAKPVNSKDIVVKGISIARPLLETISDETVSRVILRGLRKSLKNVQIAPYIGKLLQFVFTGERARLVTDELFRTIGQLVEENKLLIRKRVREGSPWFIPDFIDNRIYEKILSELNTFFSAIVADGQHPFREKFAEKMASFARKLETDDSYREIGELIKDDLLSSDNVRSICLDILKDLKESFSEKLSNPQDAFIIGVAEIVSDIAHEISTNDALKGNLNSWIRKGIIVVADQYSVQVAHFISDTVKTWDASTLVDKFEMEIGRDLQFIRVNGTLVGGFIGVIIYLIKVYAQ